MSKKCDTPHTKTDWMMFSDCVPDEYKRDYHQYFGSSFSLGLFNEALKRPLQICEDSDYLGIFKIFSLTFIHKVFLF